MVYCINFNNLLTVTMGRIFRQIVILAVTESGFVPG